MPGFSIEQHPDEPILRVTFSSDWDIGKDGYVLLEAVWAAFEAAEQPLFYIVDLTVTPQFTLDDLMITVQTLLRGSKPLLRHPNMREHLVVTQNPVLNHAMKVLPAGLGRRFDTLDEALAYARARLAH